MNADKTPLRVVLADDHHLSREGLRSMLEADGMVVIGEASNGVEAVSTVVSLAPDVAVIDLRMPGLSGAEAIRRIVTANPDVQVVVLTVSADEADVVEALASGASSYLLKDAPVEQLVAGIRQAASGHTVISGGVMRALVAQLTAASHAAERAAGERPALSAREQEVLRLIVEGADNATIGRKLSISRHTAKQYVSNVIQKLGVRSRVEAAVRAVRDGLV
jgi:DNA-binding NarL/FixJ family response regulator